MFDFMDRAAVMALKRKGLTNIAIGEKLGMHRNTVARLLTEPMDKEYRREAGPTAATPYAKLIRQWLENDVPVKRMLELVREDEEYPYKGGKSAFYRGVKLLREQWRIDRAERWSRFEGLPGEYAQVDWGEVRQLPFKDGPVKRYFLAVRLKFSRAVFVKWTDSMKLEVLIRGLIEAFHFFGGVPWILVFDNMKTVTTGRDDEGRVIWHRVFRRFASEFGFKPEVCARNRGNQKGAVENLVGWTKSSFVPERSFINDPDLHAQNDQWVTECNNSVSQAHGEIPWEVLEQEERRRLLPVVAEVEEYALMDLVTPRGSGYVRLHNVDYLVPISYAKTPVLLKLRADSVEFWDGWNLLVRYPRRHNSSKKVVRVFEPELLEELFEERPRARTMTLRDYLRERHPQIGRYIAELCRIKVGDDAFGPDIRKMYELYREHGFSEFVAACSIATSEGAYGACYLEAILQPPLDAPSVGPIHPKGDVPSQAEIDREMACYEQYAVGGAR